MSLGSSLKVEDFIRFHLHVSVWLDLFLCCKSFPYEGT